MEWFSGGVLNAISKCRQERALFIVYVSDDSEASTVTLTAWNSAEIVQFLKNTKSVALKVSKDSTEFSQFSQFFAVFTFPTVYCIDLSGKPLVVMNGKQTVEMLKSKLGEAFLKMEKPLTTKSVNPVQHSTMSPEKEPPEKEAKVVPGKLSTTAPSASGASTSESHAEKLERYEEKIKHSREERAEARQQHEIDKEKERISQGKDVLKFNELQAEQRNKNWLKERQKEKKEAQSAREDVRAKLEQDRRDREHKQQAAVSIRQRSQKGTPQQQSPNYSTSSGSKSRVQLRLPMGSTKVVELGMDDTLGILRERVAEVLDTASNKFSLTRLYPRQELTTDLDLQPMVDLKLAPTGVVIVRVHKRFTGDGGGSNVVWTTFVSIIDFIVWILSVIKNFVTGLFSSPTETPTYQETSSSNLRHGNSGSIPTERQLHKFRQEDYQDEDSDDMGTYNGNSTQQQ